MSNDQIKMSINRRKVSACSCREGDLRCFASRCDEDCPQCNNDEICILHKKNKYQSKLNSSMPQIVKTEMKNDLNTDILTNKLKIKAPSVNFPITNSEYNAKKTIEDIDNAFKTENWKKSDISVYSCRNDTYSVIFEKENHKQADETNADNGIDRNYFTTKNNEVFQPENNHRVFNSHDYEKCEKLNYSNREELNYIRQDYSNGTKLVLGPKNSITDRKFADSKSDTTRIADIIRTKMELADIDKNKVKSKFGTSKVVRGDAELTKEQIQKDTVYKLDNDTNTESITTWCKLLHKITSQFQSDKSLNVQNESLNFLPTASETSVAKLSADILNVPLSEFQKSVSINRPRNVIPKVKRCAKYDILGRIKEAYRACTCKVCKCVANIGLRSISEKEICDCKPCGCTECRSYRRSREERHVYRLKNNMTLKPTKQPDCCDCKPCQCVECAPYNVVRPITCECKACECSRCRNMSNLNKYGYPAHGTFITAPVGEKRYKSHRLAEEIGSSVYKHPSCRSSCETSFFTEYESCCSSCDIQNTNLMQKPVQSENSDYDVRSAIITNTINGKLCENDYKNQSKGMFPSLSYTILDDNYLNRLKDEKKYLEVRERFDENNNHNSEKELEPAFVKNNLEISNSFKVYDYSELNKCEIYEKSEPKKYASDQSCGKNYNSEIADCKRCMESEVSRQNINKDKLINCRSPNCARSTTLANVEKYYENFVHKTDISNKLNLTKKPPLREMDQDMYIDQLLRNNRNYSNQCIEKRFHLSNNLNSENKLNQDLKVYSVLQACQYAGITRFESELTPIIVDTKFNISKYSIDNVSATNTDLIQYNDETDCNICDNCYNDISFKSSKSYDLIPAGNCKASDNLCDSCNISDRNDSGNLIAKSVIKNCVNEVLDLDTNLGAPIAMPAEKETKYADYDNFFFFFDYNNLPIVTQTKCECNSCYCNNSGANLSQKYSFFLKNYGTQTKKIDSDVTTYVPDYNVYFETTIEKSSMDPKHVNFLIQEPSTVVLQNNDNLLKCYDSHYVRKDTYLIPNPVNYPKSKITIQYDSVQNTILEARSFSLELNKLLQKYEKANEEFESISAKLRNAHESLFSRNSLFINNRITSTETKTLVKMRDQASDTLVSNQVSTAAILNCVVIKQDKGIQNNTIVYSKNKYQDIETSTHHGAKTNTNFKELNLGINSELGDKTFSIRHETVSVLLHEPYKPMASNTEKDIHERKQIEEINKTDKVSTKNSAPNDEVKVPKGLAPKGNKINFEKPKVILKHHKINSNLQETLKMHIPEIESFFSLDEVEETKIILYENKALINLQRKTEDPILKDLLDFINELDFFGTGHDEVDSRDIAKNAGVVTSEQAKNKGIVTSEKALNQYTKSWSGTQLTSVEEKKITPLLAFGARQWRIKSHASPNKEVISDADDCWY